MVIDFIKRMRQKKPQKNILLHFTRIPVYRKTNERLIVIVNESNLFHPFPFQENV